jgi:hypothetical protein
MWKKQIDQAGIILPDRFAFRGQSCPILLRILRRVDYVALTSFQEP